MQQVIRRAQRLGVVTLFLMAGLLVLAGTASASTWDSAESRFVQKINASRSAQGLAPLGVDGQLVNVARDWTPRMIADGKISHRPNLAEVVTGDWTRLGENVGRSIRSGASESELVDRLHAAFMDSPGHRANILGDFNYVGVGVVVPSDGAMWVTVNFMLLPAGSEPTPAPTSSSTSTPSGGAAVDEAVRISKQVFATKGQSGRQAAYAVVGTAEVFADALGGSGLAADQAPVLFTPGPTDANPNPSMAEGTRAEIDRVLGGSGTVYILGGSNAVSDRAAKELAAAGYNVSRLAGATRVETSVRVADEIVRRHGAPKGILLARADDWPDAVSGGAYAASTRSPLVLTGTDSLHPATAQFLSRHAGVKRYALGGQVALADGVVSSAKATRIAGADRAATAVAVAEQLWGRTTARSGDRFTSAPARGDIAWAYALAQAPWAAANNGPQLLVSDQVPPSVSAYLGRLGYSGQVSGDVFPASVAHLLDHGGGHALGGARFRACRSSASPGGFRWRRQGRRR